MAAGKITREELIPTKSSLFPLDRDRIHLLALLRRTSGLSPPEEEELALLEGREAENDLPPDPEFYILEGFGYPVDSVHFARE